MDGPEDPPQLRLLEGDRTDKMDKIFRDPGFAGDASFISSQTSKTKEKRKSHFFFLLTE